MSSEPNLVAIVLLAHLVVFAVLLIAHYFARLPGRGEFGIYFIMLPIGFNLFGAELPSTVVAASVLAGLFLILWSARKLSQISGPRP